MKNKKRVLIALIIFGIAIRFAYVAAVGSKAPANDASSYDNIAWNLSEHGKYTSELGTPYIRRAPVFPFFLAAVYKVFGRNYLIANIFQAVLGIFTCYLVYLLALRLLGHREAVISGIIALYYPFFIYYTGILLLENTFVFLIVLTLFYLAKTSKIPSYTNIVLLGLFFSMSYLCKPVVMPFIVLSIMYLIYLWGHKKLSSYYKSFVLLFIFILPVFLWAARNKSVTGHFVVMHSGLGRELLGSSYSYDIKVKGQAFRDMIRETDDPIWAKGRDMNEYDRDKYFLAEGIKFIKGNPARFIEVSIKKFIKFWRLYPTVEYIDGSNRKKMLLILLSLFSYGILLPFSIYGAILSLKKSSIFMYFYILISTFTLLHMVLWAQIRYRLPLMPALIIFASIALVHLYDKHISRVNSTL